MIVYTAFLILNKGIITFSGIEYFRLRILAIHVVHNALIHQRGTTDLHLQIMRVHVLDLPRRFRLWSSVCDGFHGSPFDQHISITIIEIESVWYYLDSPFGHIHVLGHGIVGLLHLVRRRDLFFHDGHQFAMGSRFHYAVVGG